MWSIVGQLAQLELDLSSKEMEMSGLLLDGNKLEPVPYPWTRNCKD